MNQELDNTAYLAGDFISENAVRGALQRRRQAQHPADGAIQPAELQTPAEVPSPRASRSRRLRRWSVAELIAGAVARPPTGGVAH